MSLAKTEDWAAGISQPLRRLALAGVDDQELERFVDAMKSGSSDEVARILNSPRPPRAPPTASDPGAVPDDVLERVTTAALRRSVNGIDVRLLQRYMEIVWYVAKHVVTALRHEPFWSSDRAVIAVGDVVAKFALDQIDPSAGCP